MLSHAILMPITGLLLVSAEPAPLCQNYVPEIEVSAVPGVATEDHSLRAANLASSNDWGTLMPDHIIGTAQFSTQSEFETHEEADDICIALKRVTVVFRMDTTLRINNKSPKGSCQHEQIDLHEKHHVRVAGEFVSHSVPLIEQYLLSALKGKAAINQGGRNVKDIQASLRQTVDLELANFSKYLSEEHRKLQRQIVDSPVEVQKMFASCAGWQAPAVQP